MTLPHISLTPDVTIVAVLALMIVYGLVLGRNKVKTLALSIYVGLVVATELGAGFYQLLGSHHLDFGSRLSPSNARLTLFILPLLILELGRREHNGRGSGKGGMIMTIILCTLAAALAVSSGLTLLEPSSLKHILASSSLASIIFKFRLWWIGLVPLAVVGENFIRNKDH